MRRTQKSKQALQNIYLKKAKSFKQRHPECQAKISDICQYWTSDVHHKAGRHGSLLLDEFYWMAVCRLCHDWIGDNKSLAKEKGWLIFIP